MNVVFLSSFTRDLKKIKDRVTLRRIDVAIQGVEAADSSQELHGLEKLSGTENCYRIRVGEFRIGLKIDSNTATFVRCLNRKEIYRFFP